VLRVVLKFKLSLRVPNILKTCLFTLHYLIALFLILRNWSVRA
jgi:hypothetical protein